MESEKIKTKLVKDRDITKILREYEYIVSSSTDMIALIDERYSYLKVNDAYINAFNLARKEFINNTVSHVFGEDFFQEVIKPNADRCLKGERVNYSDWFDFPFTGRKYMEINYYPYREETNKISGFIVNARDITDRKLALNALEQLNQRLEQFAYIASHDLQEPLTTVIGLAGLIKKKYEGQLDDRYLNYILEASTRMSTLVKGLLEYSLLGHAKKLTLIDCNAVIKNVQDDLAHYINEADASFLVGDLPQLNGYKTELRLLFQNLITNAIKFRKKDSAPLIKISAQKENDYWKFSFQDNGIGIQHKYKDRIFEIFQRLNHRQDYKGTGIGLTHCKKIVEMHNGNIWVDSIPNEGSTFYIKLPIIEKL